MIDNGQAPAPPGKLAKINPAKLKLRELAEIEKLLGRRLAGELQSGDLGMDTMQALVFIELRRGDPAATFEQAGEYDLGTLMEAFADDEAETGPLDPTRPPSPAGSASSGNNATSSRARPPSTVSGG